MKGLADDLYTIMQKQNNINDPSKMHPEFTTFKYRASEGWVKRTIDYIFLYHNQYTMKKGGAVITQVMDPTQVERDGLLNTEIGFPSPDHSSDHLSIGYEVALKLWEKAKYAEIDFNRNWKFTHKFTFNINKI